MQSKKILITGANGQLGKELQRLSSNYPGFDYFFRSRQELPIEDKKQVDEFFHDVKPDYCINCGAYTAVDKAESERDMAFLINGDAVGFLSNASKATACKLIHVSTDYVFDGTSSTPLKETDATRPINIYGESKLKGELLAAQHNNETLIIRTAWVYSSFGNNFVKTMIRLMRERDSINVVNDQIGSPTYAAGLADAIMKIVSNEHFIPGIYNYSDEGKISWFDFAIAIKELIGAKCTVNPIPTSQYPTPAKRPHYSLLDKTKIRTTYGIAIPAWESNLVECINQIRKNEV